MGGGHVVVLGGGMAGLTTAWELSSGRWRDSFDSITVVQRGWRLGGKGASSRGEHGRIEEHGLHVLLGYYDATFRVLREVYEELDRTTTDPGCPLRTWRQAFEPSGDIGLVDRDGATLTPFVTRFTTDGRVPGEPGAEDRPLRPVDVAARALRLLADFHGVLGAPGAPQEVYLSTSARPRPRPDAVGGLLRAGGLTSLAAAAAVVERTARLVGAGVVDPDVAGAIQQVLRSWRADLHGVLRSSPQGWRTWELVDLVSSTLVGMLADGLLAGRGWERIDHLDFREWLARHGAATTTLDSPIVRGMYDLVFAYEGADRSRPRFAAGLGLQLASRMLFDCKGAVFWRMQAGMGEVVFAPMYEALVRRGVRFRFFHRLDRLTLSPDGDEVATIELTRQAGPAPGAGDYAPLVRHQGLPCWPPAPLAEQLDHDPGPGSEAHPSNGSSPHEVREVLRAGRDFDLAVLAVSIGMVPQVAQELLARVPGWRTMTEQVGTVATMSAQLWLDETEAELGWPGPSGVTLSGFGDVFDTWASMPHLLPREDWPPADAPRGLAYLCSAMPDHDDARDGEAYVREALTGFLDSQVEALWPRAAGPDGFRWDVLHDDRGRVGPDRLAAQYLRANLDPSDRYVQSLPGTGQHRMAPDGTGLANLLVAGDWTACGLDAGCLEAAVRSGVLAARAARGRSRSGVGAAAAAAAAAAGAAAGAVEDGAA